MKYLAEIKWRDFRCAKIEIEACSIQAAKTAATREAGDDSILIYLYHNDRLVGKKIGPRWTKIKGVKSK